MTSTPEKPQDDQWKPGEQHLRETEIQTQKWTVRTQAVASVATLAAVFVALFVALQGQQSLKSATQYNLQQAQDNQFSTALTSLGSSDIPERIAGLVLLRLNAADRLTPASSAVFGKQNAYSYYTTALEIFSGYLRSHSMGYLASAGAGHGTQPFGLGYGTPTPPGFSIDIQYALDEVMQMLNLSKQVSAVSAVTPNFDLSNDELYQQDLTGMNLSWVHAFLVGIDLRGAVMENVVLSKLDDLQYTHLQCADLQHAQLQGADLEHANLSGADLFKADLKGADLAGADLTGAYVKKAIFSGARDSHAILATMYGRAIGLPPGVVTSTAQPLSQPSCLANKSYGDPPMPNPAPVSSPSVTASPNATGKKG
jgi:hypothetical protein